MPSVPSPLMFSSGPSATSSINNTTGQSTASSRFQFTPFCLPPADSAPSTAGQFSSSSASSSGFHSLNECNNTVNTTTLLFGNQQQPQSQPSFYPRYPNGSFP